MANKYSEHLQPLVGSFPEETIEKLDFFFSNTNLDKKEKKKLVDILLGININSLAACIPAIPYKNTE